jgi:transcriptional/translational regulatory protein YebC/TACO1
MRQVWRPKNPVKVEDSAQKDEVVAFLTAIDEDDDVQHIYAALAD